MKLVNIALLALLVVGLFAGAASSAQAQEWNPACASAPSPRLSTGQQGRVTPGLPNALRTQPGRGWDSSVLAWIPGNAAFSVLQGFAPQCADGMYWWYVSYNNVAGWTPEGSAWGEYWTVPLTDNGQDATCPQPLRLNPGTLAKVTPNHPEALRYTAGGDESTIVAWVPANGVVTVQYGYGVACANGMHWYYVSYNNILGWMPEGWPGAYNLDPYGAMDQCATGITPRLTVGGWGRVTPGLPNNLRGGPALGAARLGQIPSGGVFQVVNGPACSNGITWWQVNYNGVVGWTGEGRWGTYWLAPA